MKAPLDVRNRVGSGHTAFAFVGPGSAAHPAERSSRRIKHLDTVLRGPAWVEGIFLSKLPSSFAGLATYDKIILLLCKLEKAVTLTLGQR
jgi:hypothetical protein